MDAALLLAAFATGFAARRIGMPPLVGYLAAGFGLHALGVQPSAAVEAVGDLGVLVLLFGIGLKLRVQTLARPQVWVTASAFAVVGIAAMALLLALLAAVDVPLAADLDVVQVLTVALALSFCSTVFTVKALERANETASVAGRVAVGILVLQDLLAVAYLVATGTAPSPWAVLVVPALLLLRPALGWVLDRAGHGETLVLFGVTAALGVGAELFAAVDLKPDLGALVVGVLLSAHRRAPELSSRLLDLKDLLLVGFFLSIGMAGTPTGAAWLIGGVALLVLPLRTLLLLWLLTRLHLRGRTALGASLSLSTYSEFGLIVTAAAASAGVLDEAWLATVAVAVACSFVVASVAGRLRYTLHGRVADRIARLERPPIVPDDALIDIGDARILVFGMGRVGTGAYDELVIQRGPCVLGVEHNDQKLAAHRERGRAVIRGDALDRDFWERVRLHDGVELVVASMGRHHANVECVRRIREFLPHARIASIAHYPDEVAELQAAGVDVARNLYEEAGQALAYDTVEQIYRP